MADNNRAKNILDRYETKAINTVVAFQKRRALKKYVRSMPQLTSSQKAAVKEFWKPYCNVDTDWVRYYTAITGLFDPRYIPDDLQHTKIDQFFNQKKAGFGFNDKNYYSLIFPDIKQPKTVVRKIGGLLFDKAYHQIDIEQAVSLLTMRPEVIVKISQDCGKGRNIRFFETTGLSLDKLKKVLLDPTEKNFIVQDIVKQHYELAKMHPQSLNTIRIYTLMMEDGVHILSVTMRMGANENRIDNGSAKAGIFAGVKYSDSEASMEVSKSDDGRLMNFAFSDMFCSERTDRHPQGMLLSEIRVPSFDKMIDTVKRAAQYIGNFQLVGWDLSVNEDGDVVLIEANMRRVDIGPIQCLHGPFYGDVTKNVLDKVFSVNCKL